MRDCEETLYEHSYEEEKFVICFDEGEIKHSKEAGIFFI